LEIALPAASQQQLNNPGTTVVILPLSIEIDVYENYYNQTLNLITNASSDAIDSAFQRERRFYSPISKEAKPLWFDTRSVIRQRV